MKKTKIKSVWEEKLFSVHGFFLNVEFPSRVEHSM